MNLQANRWQSKKALALFIALALAGCKSGHEGGDSTDPTDPSAVSINIPEGVSVTEPSSGSATNEVGITLSASLSSDLTLTATTSDISATSTGQFKNYNAVDTSIVIPAGATTATIPVDILHNDLFEGAKELKVTISAATSSLYTIENSETVITVSDNDTMPTVSFSSDLSTVVEGDSITQQAVLTNYTSQDVTITLAQTGIAASDDYDVDITDLTLTLPAETLSTDITFSAKDDGFNEGGESVIYTISAVGNAILDSNNSTLAFYIPGQKSYNDTGYVTYFDGTAYDSVTPPSDYPNQDANYGLDTTEGDIHQDGEYGFRFTKLDLDGNPVAPTESDWRCVRDERTGLYIEAKQAALTTMPTQAAIDAWVEAHQDDPDANPYPWSYESSQWRSSSNTYTWYDSATETNGGYPGAQNDLLYAEGPIAAECAFATNASGNQYCNTENYIANMNNFAVCGITDWRLPSPVEARSFISYNDNALPVGAVEFFPNLGQRIFTHSSSVKLNGSARCIDTSTGEVELCNKNHASTGIVAVSGGIE